MYFEVISVLMLAIRFFAEEAAWFIAWNRCWRADWKLLNELEANRLNQTHILDILSKIELIWDLG